MRTLWADVRYAWRQMRATPGFALTVVLVLGLGIGATTAIFSLVHAVMLKSLPVAEPERLYQFGAGEDRGPARGLQGEWVQFSYLLYQQIEKSAPQFDHVTAFQAQAGILSVREGSSAAQARPLMGEYVSGNYFQTFGVGAYLGRTLLPSDDVPSAAPVAVMNYGTWKNDYHSNAAVVGSVFHIENHAFTIVGIAPPGFFGETLSATPTSLWVPLESEFLIDGPAAFNLLPSQSWLHVIGHLKPGATTAGVSEELSATLEHWLVKEADLPPEYTAELATSLARQRISLRPGGAGIGTMKAAYGDSLRSLFGLCAAVLLLACANVANLLLARGMARRTQTAVEMALGASRARLMRRALTESATLAMLGGAVGIAIAWGGAGLVVLLAFRHQNAVPISVEPSLPMLGFCFALSLLTGLLFGIVPAWISTRVDPMEALRGAGRTTQEKSSLPQRMLVVLQVMISVVLIAVASMLTHSIVNLQKQDFGFALEHRISVVMEPPLPDYSVAQLNRMYEKLTERLKQLPGVESASVALDGPFMGSFNLPVVKPGEGMPQTDGSQSAMWDRVSAGYFETIGQKVIRGRAITDADRNNTHGVVVVNEAFVRRYFSHADPIGQHFGFFEPGYANTLEIVGVVRDAKYRDPSLPVEPMAFGALTQETAYAREIQRGSEKWSHFINNAQLHAKGNVASLEPGIREAFREADPNFTIMKIQTMQDQVDANFDQQRAVAQLSSLFGVLALVLASIGLYGVTAYAVARRTNEIGVRMALGADRMRIVRLIVRGALTQVGVGLLLGVPVALLLGHVLAARLYRVGEADPVALVTAILSLVLFALAASLLPARRAASVDPMVALRAD